MDNADHVAAGKFGFNIGIKNLERFSKFIPLKIIGGDVKILNEKLHFKEKAQSKCGSMDNADHVAAGGDVKIYSSKVDVSVSITLLS